MARIYRSFTARGGRLGWVRALHSEDSEKLTSTWKRIIATGQPGAAEARLRGSDGRYRWFHFRAVPFRDERGEIVRSLGTNTDIEDLKREVLISGGSGTGKELVARAIHEQGARGERPIVKLNCSAVSEGLFESEFFGHVRGAFTGALRDKPGRFELAEGGTLFLDEIADVPVAMQAKLLRVLQEQELERVGDTRTRKIDVRVIAATNKNLGKEVDEGRFRPDLFYRLNVFPIEVPPLRKRRDDIAPLVAHFIRHSARRINRLEPQVSKAAFDQLASYDWPGNVRELQNTIEHAMILWRGGPLTYDLPAPRACENTAEKLSAPSALLTRDELKRQERDAIVNALRRTNGKISGPGGAAKLLGTKPSTLASRISSLGIDRRDAQPY